MSAVSIALTSCALIVWSGHLVYRVRVNRPSTGRRLWPLLQRMPLAADELSLTPARRREMTRLSREADDLIKRITSAAQRSGDDSIVSAVAAKLAGEVPRAVAAAMDRETGRSDALIREISHSLNTPLGHIEAAALLMRDTSEDTATVENAHGLIAAVGICKAFLGAFREMGSIGLSEMLWAPTSLGDFLRESIGVYAAKNDKQCDLRVELPESLPGYTNNFVMSVLLPLVENAVEALPGEGGRLVVQARFETKSAAILVMNTCDPATTIPDSVYEPHITSKADHTGMGLVAVQDLLSVHSGARLSHAVADCWTTFEIILPGRFAA